MLSNKNKINPSFVQKKKIEFMSDSQNTEGGGSASSDDVIQNQPSIATPPIDSVDENMNQTSSVGETMNESINSDLDKKYLFCPDKKDVKSCFLMNLNDNKYDSMIKHCDTDVKGKEKDKLCFIKKL